MASPHGLNGRPHDKSQRFSFPGSIVDSIRAVVGPGPAALHEPRFSALEVAFLQECIESTFVSSVGTFVDRFEKDLCEFTGSPFAVAVVNGTEALHVALVLAGVRPNDEVLVPALSFIATANAVSYCGAVPHFVDSEVDTLGLDPVALDAWLRKIAVIRDGVCTNRTTGRVIKAVVPMHTFGHPSLMGDLMGVADEYGLAVVEDAAEGLGSWYRGKHVGTFANLGILSFNGNKTITTGGGGAILTSDSALAARAKHLTTTSRVPHRWEFEHDEIGFNYRMPNLNAALGCAQMVNLPQMLASKRTLTDRYLRAFESIAGVAVVTEPANCQSNYWLQAILLDEDRAEQRDAVLEATNDAGLMTRPAWRLIPDQPPYADSPSAPLVSARSLQARLINIPSSAFLVR
jgi:perosamine synthetase